MSKRFRAVREFVEVGLNEVCAAELQLDNEEPWLQFWSRAARQAVGLMDRQVKVKSDKDWTRVVAWHKMACTKEKVETLRSTILSVAG